MELKETSEPLLRNGSSETSNRPMKFPTKSNTKSNSTKTSAENEAVAERKDDSLLPSKTQSSGSVKESVSESGKEEEPTQWGGLWICGLIMYLTTSMGQTLAVSGWPYLRTIDPTVPVSFLGYVQGLTKCGHAIGSCIFAVHAYTYKTFRKALIVGRIMSVAGCAFYIFIEVFSPPYRRWAYMLKFLLQSVAEGSLIVVRSYVPRMSREVDRQKAFSIIEGANMLAIVSGPLVQLICHLLPERGDDIIFSWLRFNMFTVPIWISLIMNILTLYIAAFHFKEPKLTELKDESRLPLKQAMKKAWRQIKKLDRWLVILCFFEKSCASYGFAAMYTTMSPYVTETFNVGEAKALLVLSVAQTVAGGVSLITVATFVFTPIARIAKARYLFPFALSCYLIMYVMSFPWPGITEDIPLRNNETAPFGCDAERYSWCGDGLKIPDHRLWLATSSVLFGIAIPVSLIAFDTIYSKVLGGIDQNVMQGLLIIMDDLALAGAPMVSTTSFEAFGPGPMWLSVAGICLTGLILWILILPKLRKLNI